MKDLAALEHDFAFTLRDGFRAFLQLLGDRGALPTSELIAWPVYANEPAGTRTQDLRIKSPLLYQLSYRLADKVTLPRDEWDAIGVNTSHRRPPP